MSNDSRFHIGQIVANAKGERFVMTEVNPAVDQLLLRASSGYVQPFTISQFTRLVVDGLYAIVNLAEQPLLNPIPRHILLTERQKEGEKHRHELLNRVHALRSKGNSWPEVIEAMRSSFKGVLPCIRTLQRWERASKAGHPEPGKPGWRKGKSRLCTEIVEAVEAVLKTRTEAKTRELLNATTLRREVEAEANQGNQSGERITVSERSLIRLLERRVPWRENLKDVLERRTLRAATRTAVHHVDADRPLELVEIDSTPLSYHYFDDKGRDLGQPTLYVLIDVATETVLGARAYDLPAGVEPLMDFLEYAIYPKNRASKHGEEAPWGRMERLLSDQGPEYQSSFYFAAANRLRFEPVFAEGEAGWKKPFIERFFETLYEMLIKRIPGSTYSTARKTVDPDLPSRTGALTLRMLNEIIEEFVYDIWPDLVSERLSVKFLEPDMTPRKAWSRLTKEYPPTVPVSRETYRETTYELLESNASLDHAGVRLNNLEYSSPALKALYMVTGPTSVDLYGPPMDAGTLCVKHAASNQAVIATSKRPVAHGIPRRLWREVAKSLKLGRVNRSDAEIQDQLARLIGQAHDAALPANMGQRRKQARPAARQRLADKANSHKSSDIEQLADQVSDHEAASKKRPQQKAVRETTSTSLDDFKPIDLPPSDPKTGTP